MSATTLKRFTLSLLTSSLMSFSMVAAASDKPKEAARELSKEDKVKMEEFIAQNTENLNSLIKHLDTGCAVKTPYRYLVVFQNLNGSIGNIYFCSASNNPNASFYKEFYEFVKTNINQFKQSPQIINVLKL